MDSYYSNNMIPLIFKSDNGKYFFQFHINSQVASLEYALEGKGILALKHLEISRFLDAGSVGDALIERVLNYVHGAGFKVIPKSVDVQQFINRKTEYRKLVYTNLALNNKPYPAAVVNGVAH